MKQFTSILFGLVLVLGLQIDRSLGQPYPQYPASPTPAENAASFCTPTVISSVYGGVKDKCLSCFQAIDQPTKVALGCPVDTSASEQKCSSAYSDWQKSIKENGNACAKFVGESKKETCSDVVNKCRQQVNSSTAIGGTSTNGMPSTGNDSIDQLTNMTIDLFQAKNGTSNSEGVVSKKNISGSCYKFSNKAIRDLKKEKDDKIAKLKKDIQEQKKAQNEANEKLSKETNDIKVEQQKLQAETAKTLQKLDVEKREKLTKMNEDLQKAATDIRKQTTDIIKTKQAMEKLKFENQKKMTAYTEDKINEQCKSALSTAKTCFVKASKGTKFTKDDTCSNFSFSGKGTKGTAELKKKLKQVQEACFEQSNQAVSTIKYEYADQVRTYEMDIKEKQEQISDANKSLEAKKTENESISKETETQKSQEQKNLEEQISNFTQKLQDLDTHVKKTIADSEAIEKDLQNELARATAVEVTSDLGITTDQEMLEFAYDEAEAAIEANNAALARARGDCRCGTKSPDPKCQQGLDSSSNSKKSNSNSLPKNNR